MEIYLILEISTQLNKLNAISVKRKDSSSTTVKEVTLSAGVTSPSEEDLDLVKWSTDGLQTSL